MTLMYDMKQQFINLCDKQIQLNISNAEIFERAESFIIELFDDILNIKLLETKFELFSNGVISVDIRLLNESNYIELDFFPDGEVNIRRFNIINLPFYRAVMRLIDALEIDLKDMN